MTIRKYNPIIDKIRTKDENYIPTGVYFNYLVDTLNNSGGDGTLVFVDEVAQNAYFNIIPDVDRIAGQLAVVLTLPGQIYTLNSLKTAWIPVSVTVDVEPGGATTQIQFNDAGDFGGDSKLTWNKLTSLLTVSGLIRYNAAPTVENTLDVPHKGYIDGLVQNTLKIRTNWNADTNTPTLNNTTTAGSVYIVSVPGATNLGGITTWEEGDWAIRGTEAGEWARIPANTVDLTWVAITGTISDNESLQGELDDRPMRNTTTAVVDETSTLIFDFRNMAECFATKAGGGAIAIDEDITIEYTNNSYFNLLYFPVETSGEFDLTFPIGHISGDQRWTAEDGLNAPYLTLVAGFYQISVVFNGAYYSVVCSQMEV